MVHRKVLEVLEDCKLYTIIFICMIIREGGKMGEREIIWLYV